MKQIPLYRKTLPFLKKKKQYVYGSDSGFRTFSSLTTATLNAKKLLKDRTRSTSGSDICRYNYRYYLNVGSALRMSPEC